MPFMQEDDINSQAEEEEITPCPSDQESEGQGDSLAASESCSEDSSDDESGDDSFIDDDDDSLEEESDDDGGDHEDDTDQSNQDQGANAPTADVQERAGKKRKRTIAVSSDESQ